MKTAIVKPLLKIVLWILIKLKIIDLCQMFLSSKIFLGKLFSSSL